MSEFTFFGLDVRVMSFSWYCKLCSRERSTFPNFQITLSEFRKGPFAGISETSLLKMTNISFFHAFERKKSKKVTSRHKDFSRSEGLQKSLKWKNENGNADVAVHITCKCNEKINPSSSGMNRTPFAIVSKLPHVKSSMEPQMLPSVSFFLQHVLPRAWTKTWHECRRSRVNSEEGDFRLKRIPNNYLTMYLLPCTLPFTLPCTSVFCTLSQSLLATAFFSRLM